jgi:chromosome partitioning protein
MITVIGGLKGGAGKTTIATNLAAMRSLSCETVLIDADPQASSSDWALMRIETDKPKVKSVRVEGSNARVEALRLSGLDVDVIIDCGGKDCEAQRAAMSVADMFVVPFRPGTYDVWAFQQLETLIGQAKKIYPKFECLAFLNGADINGPDNADAIAIANTVPGVRVLTTTICNRKSFRSSAADGLAVTEWRNTQRKIDHKAIAEITDIYQAIFGGGYGA